MKHSGELIKKCIDAGAFKAAVINVSEIDFDANLRTYCEANTCGNYDKNYACPPDVGGIEEVISRAESFDKALVYQTVTRIQDSFDFEGMKKAADRHTGISNLIDNEIKKISPKYLQLTAGGCTVCEVCGKINDQPCSYPEKAISSLEAYCMNVVNLAELCNMDYTNGADTVTYFGAFLM